MNRELITIIVPIYKVEKYINECIDSILGQTYTNIEILLIDDGSPDNCPKICDDYALKDTRIKVFHKKNGGLSDARNYGINYSKGKYLMFVDSDDYIEKDMVEILYKNLKKYNADISSCGYIYLYKSKKIKNDKKTKTIIMNTDEAMKELNKQNGIGIAAWNKLYKRDLFNTQKFPKGKVNEDWYIMYKIFSKARKIVYQPDAKYYYRQRVSSISKDIEINYNPILASSQCRKFIVQNYPKAQNEAYGNEIIANIAVYNRLINKKGNKIKKSFIKHNIKRNMSYIKKSDYFKTFKKFQIMLLLYCPYIYKIAYAIKKSNQTNFFD